MSRELKSYLLLRGIVFSHSILRIILPQTGKVSVVFKLYGVRLNLIYMSIRYLK